MAGRKSTEYVRSSDVLEDGDVIEVNSAFVIEGTIPIPVGHMGIIVPGILPNHKVIHFTPRNGRQIMKTDLAKFMGAGNAKKITVVNGASKSNAAQKAEYYYNNYNPQEIGRYNVVSNNCKDFVKKCYEKEDS